MPTQPAPRQTARAHSGCLGDIFVCVWGSPRRLVEFYKVTRVMPKSVELTQLMYKAQNYSGPTEGYVTPNPDKHYIERVGGAGGIISAGGYRAPADIEVRFIRRVMGGLESPYIRITDTATAVRWNGNPVSFDHNY